MKRFLLIAGVLLLGLVMRAQSVSYTCRYWFDHDQGQMVTATAKGNILQMELEVGVLSEGIHNVFIQVRDTSGMWCAAQSYMFYKAPIPSSPTNPVNPADVVYHCWFDNDIEHEQIGAFQTGAFLLDADVLESGLHTLFVALEGDGLTSTQSYIFYKAPEPASINPVNPANIVYHCWYDNDIEHEQTGQFQAGAFLLDADALESGLHTLFVALEGDGLTSTQSYMFYKAPEPVNPINPENVVYHCWFDEDIEHEQTGALQMGAFLLDADALESGLHTLFVALEGNGLTSTQSYMFYKAPEPVNPINPENVVYHCWFDEDIEHEQTGALQMGAFLLDADALESGLHTLFVALEGNGLTSTQSYMFYKASELVNPVNPTDVVYHCWFDNDIEHEQTGQFQTGTFLLETDALESGLHTLFVVLQGDGLTSTQSYMFYKAAPPEREHIARWEYWLNDGINQRHTTNLSPYLDSINIISLLPVETWPIRSSCFHFHPNGDEPYLNAKNMITFRFWNTQRHFIEESKYFVDENVSEPIVADTLERNTTTTIPAPRDNQIHWFKLAVSRGDYLSLQADKACTMQLFAPSGEEVYAASGPESIQEIGFNAWENGTYYLAVHDVMGSGETVSITYNWIYRYSILSYDVHLVGNGGCSTITFQGNGFNSLIDAYLVNYQNDTIRQLDIGHESNTTTTISFNFYEENLGVYDAVFEFFDETIRVNGALEVQEPVDILLTSTVSYPSRFLRNTPCTYTYTITNNGNMSAYAVPIYVYLSTNTMDGISLIEFDGIKLPSLIDGVDLDTLSPSRIEELKEISDIIGDIHHFFIHKTIDEETGDSIIVWSNFFFLDFAPFETKTLTLKITSNESLDVWMTVPNEIVPPLTLHPDREWFGSWCCVKDNWTCLVDLICGTINIVNLVSQLFPGSPAHIYSGVASCICGIISMGLNIFSAWKCEGEGSFVGMAYKIKNSIPGAVASCVSCFIPSVNKEGAIIVKGLVKNLIASITSTVSGAISVDESCTFEKKKKPNCPPGDSKGGKSNAVNSLDPNDIYGYLSESGSHYMRQEIQNVQYEIEFENDTTLATAAAHTIIVRDTLNRSRFDLNSLAARSVTIGDKRLDLNGEQTFARTLDLRPELYVIAQVEQDYDPTTGIIQWTIQSLDPMTMEPTNDPNQGVLPVNYYGNGVGFIDYSVNLKHAFPDGTKIRNRAGIIFDQNDVIMTPTWTNIIDAVKPVSYIENVTFEADTLNFSFVSSDNRSGVWYHTLYYRNDSTEMEWKVKVPKIVENSYMLRFNEYQTTEYLVMAVDSAGNHEDKEMVAEYVHYYDGPESVCQTYTLFTGWNWWSTYLDITLGDLKTALVDALPGTTINIKSQTQNVKYQNGRWAGQLTALDLTRMYMISVENDCEISLVGAPINLSGLTVTINNGANWLAFPYSESMTVTDFFGSFPMSNDQVKSQSRNARYQGGRWGGQLNTLMPGKGYIYISNSPGTRTFTFPISTK